MVAKNCKLVSEKCLTAQHKISALDIFSERGDRCAKRSRKQYISRIMQWNLMGDCDKRGQE